MCLYASHRAGKKKDPDKRKERKTETGEYGWTVLFHFQFEWFHYLDIIRPRSAHSPFLLWTFHSERISFCRCISIRSLAYFSRTHVLTQHWIKANCSTGHGWFIHTFAFSFFIFLPKKRKTYPPPPQIWYPSYTPLESWQTEGLLGLWSHWASEWDFSLGAS